MGETQKLIIAVAGLFAVGFIMVGTNDNQTEEQKESAAMIRAVAAMQNMATQKCPKLIKKHTGTSPTSLVSRTDSDHATYLTLEWKGEKEDSYKLATCTLQASLGGISKLVIDGEAVIDKE
ncbi:MAG: hypothetical protein HFP81_10875 [Methylococcales symbiont of Hymedesmia sp. n. MRB-2018]|nr:MAG: hypothetical protein HFP78_10010 [Methylococcales symbiont of Hymedesmia sp. n. MRB-2018]KAF3982828.1 MAG: hypothetical protein HFP81_10875 [Methylococcales symbiont of Hymedesmia sp. n. MRB-2018]